MRFGAVAFASLCWLMTATATVSSQPQQEASQQSAPSQTSVLQRFCSDTAETGAGSVTLSNTARALRDRKKIKVLAIGATPLNERDQTFGHYVHVKKVLEASFRGVDVEVVDRGVSGELARDGAERIKTEVALVEPDLVFWQVGVADALALTSASALKATLTGAVTWLRAHNVDVVLIGLKYRRSLAANEGFQRIRDVIKDVVREQSILRLSHYESMEALDKLRRQEGEVVSELDLTDEGSVCLADFLSRALAAGLFAKPKAEKATLPGVEPRLPGETPPVEAPVGSTPPAKSGN